MADIQRVGDLDIDQDMQHEKQEWSIQRVAWVGMLLLVVAALLGLFGEGWLSSRTTQGSDLKVQYQHFLRREAPARLEIVWLNTRETPILRLSRDYLQHFQIENIQPEPDQVSSEGPFQMFKFQRLEAGTHIIFDLKTQRAGRIEGQVGGSAGEMLPVRHFVYP